MENVAEDNVIAHLKETFGEDILTIEAPYNFATITVKQARIIEIIKYLYDHQELQFQYLTTLCGIHYPEQDAIAVMYQLHSLVNNKRLRLKIYLPASSPVTSTLTGVFASANWMERETFDFFGVQFQGHPDLRKILNVEDMLISPLRKEFPLEDQTREDKKDYMFGR